MKSQSKEKLAKNDHTEEPTVSGSAQIKWRRGFNFLKRNQKESRTATEEKEKCVYIVCLHCSKQKTSKQQTTNDKNIRVKRNCTVFASNEYLKSQSF